MRDRERREPNERNMPLFKPCGSEASAAADSVNENYETFKIGVCVCERERESL